MSFSSPLAPVPAAAAAPCPVTAVERGRSPGWLVHCPGGRAKGTFPSPGRARRRTCGAGPVMVDRRPHPGVAGDPPSSPGPAQVPGTPAGCRARRARRARSHPDRSIPVLRGPRPGRGAGNTWPLCRFPARGGMAEARRAPSRPHPANADIAGYNTTLPSPSPGPVHDEAAERNWAWHYRPADAVIRDGTRSRTT